MKILLLQIEKTQEPYLEQGIDKYLQRLKNYCKLEIKTIGLPKNVRQKSINEQKMEEAKLILKEVTNEDFLILLDENGKHYSSKEFSQFIIQKQNASIKRVVFLIGGPFGFDEKMYSRANSKISFSKMTFSHQMIRLFFVEQLYRAYTIIGGESYHHE